jgi:hypothetical protein
MLMDNAQVRVRSYIYCCCKKEREHVYREVYRILFRLENSNGWPEYSFIALIQKQSFVVKTKKPNGFHIYWLSHKQHESILTRDCKAGCEFEIKSGKDSGHCTLPPSIHREDANFHYKNYGQQKLFVSESETCE